MVSWTDIDVRVRTRGWEVKFRGRGFSGLTKGLPAALAKACLCALGESLRILPGALAVPIYLFVSTGKDCLCRLFISGKFGRANIHVGLWNKYCSLRSCGVSDIQKRSYRGVLGRIRWFDTKFCRIVKKYSSVSLRVWCHIGMVEVMQCKVEYASAEWSGGGHHAGSDKHCGVCW